jgi:RimJ/RimL family protein N-acetyltransferase
MSLEAGSIEPPFIELDELFALDCHRSEDAEAHRRFALDPEAARFLGWTVEQAESASDSHYDEVVRRFAREWNDGTRFSLVIRRRLSGEAVGTVELRPKGSEADVSYMVVAEWRGKGLAQLALEALLTWGQRELRLQHANLSCHVGNAASRRVAEKCRFLLIERRGDELRFRRYIGHPEL